MCVSVSFLMVESGEGKEETGLQGREQGLWGGGLDQKGQLSRKWG